MSGSREQAEYFHDLIAPVGDTTLRAMFGGWGIACGGTQFAIIMDTLYFRVDEQTRAEYEAAGSEPFSYMAKGKRVFIRSYMSVPADAIDSSERLVELADAAIEASRRDR